MEWVACEMMGHGGGEGTVGGQGGAGSAAESTTKRRRGALGPTPQRSRTDKGGRRPPGSTTAQPLKRAEGGDLGKGPVHQVSALLRSPHIEPVDDVIVREPGKLHKAVAEQLDRPRPAQACGCCPPKSPGCSLVAPHHNRGRTACATQSRMSPNRSP